jgi:hypothetical protein
MFTFNSIRFYEGCKYLKNLHVGIDYSIKHKLDKDFFAPNICISAIVGQNGAGKSSLLDMIFRVVNNLSYCLFNKVEREASSPLSYIIGIQADLTYFVNDKIGAVRVRDGILGFDFGKLKCKFTIYKLENQSSSEVDDIFREYKDYTNLDFIQQKEVAKAFFYTVATNYSMQSFIAQDYSNETAIYTIDKDDPKNIIYSKSWLNSLFHKNDGYLSPIVLNPYRENGSVDMSNEEHLTTSRLAALLIEENPEQSLLDGYSFECINFHWKPRRLQAKFTSIVDDRVKLYPSKEEVEEHNRYNIEEKAHLIYKENADLEDFRDLALEKDSFAHIILAALRCSVTPTMNHLQLYVRMYVVYKVLSVAEKYPSYTYFKKNFGNINYTFHSIPIENRKAVIAQLQKLAKMVKCDPSHIGLKLRQALNFITKGKNLTDVDLAEGITYEQYAKLLGITPKGMSIKKRMEWLPPGIFNSETCLKDKNTNAKIPLNQLSSGERQFIYLTSTLLYHAMNLNSIPKNGTRVRYNKLNFILDEVEICFHPEYQRRFVKKLRDLLVRVELNKSFDINVLITTHSPFILSDIPKDNILCMDKGKVCEGVLKQTFCSNVYDLLNNQFFMSQFVGDIATEKLDNLVHKINELSEKYNANPISEKTIKRLRNNIDMIGDDFIRMKLLEQLKALTEDDPLKVEYEMLKERLRIVEEKIKKTR